MRKIVVFFIISFTFLNIVNAYNITKDDDKLIDSFVDKVNNISEQKTEGFKDAILEKLTDIIDSDKYTIKVNTILQESIDRLTEEDKKIEKIEEIEEIEEKNILNEKDTGKLADFNIDFPEVRDYLLGLYTKVREANGLEKYNYNEKLQETAFTWSETQKEKGEATHKRNVGDSYYDYDKINSWFAENGVVCKNDNRFTHTENIARGEFYCSDGECTDEIKTMVKTSFDFFMSEKDKDYKPHYESVINKYFKNIGLGIAIDKVKENYYKYYLTIHYCTELIEK